MIELRSRIKLVNLRQLKCKCTVENNTWLLYIKYTETINQNITCPENAFVFAEFSQKRPALITPRPYVNWTVLIPCVDLVTRFIIEESGNVFQGFCIRAPNSGGRGMGIACSYFGKAFPSQYVADIYRPCSIRDANSIWGTHGYNSQLYNNISRQLSKLTISFWLRIIWIVPAVRNYLLLISGDIDVISVVIGIPQKVILKWSYALPTRVPNRHSLISKSQE